MNVYIVFLICIALVVTFYFFILRKNKYKSREVKSARGNSSIGEVVHVIVAGIAAYESSFRVNKGVNKSVIKRIFHKRKKEEISWWRIKGRIL